SAASVVRDFPPTFETPTPRDLPDEPHLAPAYREMVYCIVRVDAATPECDGLPLPLSPPPPGPARTGRGRIGSRHGNGQGMASRDRAARARPSASSRRFFLRIRARRER